MEKVSIDLEHRGEAVSRNTVCEAAGGTKEFVLKAITALVIEGFVSEEDGERRTKLLRSARPYREENDIDPLSDEFTGSAVRQQWFANHSAKRPVRNYRNLHWFGSGSA
jgi:hypothetical protein